MELPQALQEELVCPVCFEIPTEKIFLCKNRHMICESCSSKLTICPQCMENLETLKVENRVFQMLMDNLKFSCPHKDRGCNFKVSRCDYKIHTIDCEFSPMRVNFCKHIGLDCGFSTNLMNISSALMHFKRDHKFATTTNLSFLLKIELEANFKLSKSSIWNPILIEANEAPIKSKGTFPAQLVIICVYHSKDHTMSLTCFCLTTAAKFHVEFLIRHDSLRMPDISWRTPVLDVEKVDIYMPESLFRIPLTLLAQNYFNKQQKALNVQVRLIPMAAKTPNIDIAAMFSQTLVITNLDKHNKDSQGSEDDSNESSEDKDESEVSSERTED